MSCFFEDWTDFKHDRYVTTKEIELKNKLKRIIKEDKSAKTISKNLWEYFLSLKSDREILRKKLSKYTKILEWEGIYEDVLETEEQKNIRLNFLAEDYKIIQQIRTIEYMMEWIYEKAYEIDPPVESTEQNPNCM